MTWKYIINDRKYIYNREKKMHSYFWKKNFLKVILSKPKQFYLKERIWNWKILYEFLRVITNLSEKNIVQSQTTTKAKKGYVFSLRNFEINFKANFHLKNNFAWNEKWCVLNRVGSVPPVALINRIAYKRINTSFTFSIVDILCEKSMTTSQIWDIA